MTNGQAIVTERKNAPSGFMQHARYEHLVAGLLGGASATLVLHPLDLIKIRFQGEASCEWTCFCCFGLSYSYQMPLRFKINCMCFKYRIARTI